MIDDGVAMERKARAKREKEKKKRRGNRKMQVNMI
jgi:hypothetical protein